MKNQPVRVLNLFTIMNRGGAETMCMNLFRSIDRSRVQFDFLVYYPERGAYDDEIESLGGRIYRIPHLDMFQLRNHIRGARAFLKAHPEYRVVHNHMGENGAFICREASRAGVGTIIYHSHFEREPLIHVNPKVTCRRVINYFLYRMSRRFCTRYFACGSKAASFYDSGVREITVLKNAIDVGRFQFDLRKRDAKRGALNFDNGFVLGNVARFESMKNHKFLLEVFRAVLEQEPNAKLLLIGDGSLKSELLATVDRYRLREHVYFAGVRNDVDEWLQAMDVFVFPSIREGLPVSCIEAQAAGLPCVFSDGFDHETAITEDCRFLSLRDPVDKWAATILAFRNFNRRDTGEMIRAAGYDINRTSKDMEAYYQTYDGEEGR